MRRLIALVVVATALWGGYWVVGSIGLDRGLRAWIDSRQSDGWVAEYSDLQVRGFPNRFDTTFTDLDLADPESGLAWSLPFFQILALSYRPNHVIVAWPETHQISTPNERLTLNSSNMQASVVIEPGADLVLDRATLVTEALEITSTRGWTSGAADFQLSTRQTEGVPQAHDISIEASEVALAAPLKRQLDPLSALPDQISKLRLLANATFDGPWDRFAIERARPQPIAIEIDDLTALWGDLELRVAGDVSLDASGMAGGEITVKAVNWQEMLDIAVAAGAVPEASRSAIESGLRLVAGMSGRADTIDAPLTILNGRIFLGPIPIGSIGPIRIP